MADRRGSARRHRPQAAPPARLQPPRDRPPTRNRPPSSTLGRGLRGGQPPRDPGRALDGGRSRRHLPGDRITVADGIPVTDPILTLADIAATWPADRLEAAINRADKRNLVNPERLRAALPHLAAIPGVARLRGVLDRRTFRLTDSELERTFLRIVQSAGLELPQTAVVLNGFKVDFFWPELGLIVETDGLRYHRTAAQQAVDRRRDQVHTAGGHTTLRFTHYQVAHEAEEVARILTLTVERLRARR